MSDRELIDRLLDDRTYHIEFNGHLTNHSKHAVVALAGLGVPAPRIKAYYENYAKLTTYGYGLEPPRPDRITITEENWRTHLGQRSSFWSYTAFFDGRVQELGLEETVRRYVPVLLPGWAGAFTHATIHLGWALEYGSRWMAVEGLAYMAFTYVDCHPERIVDRYEEATPIDSLLRVAGAWDQRREELKRSVAELIADTSPVDDGRIHPELLRSGLQFRIARTLDAGPALIRPAEAWAADEAAPVEWEELYYAATLLYLARPGDFVLLHLITSLYAVEHICAVLPVEQRRFAVRCFWTGLLGIVFSGGDFPERDKLAALHELFADARDTASDACPEQDWRRTVARAVLEEEEHNPKLVHALHQVWQRGDRRSLYRVAAAQFTATPELPPTFDAPPAE
jgi:hypothetical protein